MRLSLGFLFQFLQWVTFYTDAIHSYDIQDRSQNPFQIFNTVNSALRIWDSALHHNGLSCFKAVIPQDIRLYHGSNSDRPVKGLTWLAFDIQHALIFTKTPTTESFATFSQSSNSSIQTGLNRPEDMSHSAEYGWQHEYATTRPLTAVYFDGLSSDKTTMGTLDMQEILLNRPLDAAPISDSTRARKLCALLREWNIDVDGIVRMEHGIEVILCEAEETLTAIHISNRRIPHSWSSTKSMFANAGSLTEYFRTAFARDHNFGPTKSKIDFATMVTAVGYTQSGSTSLPSRIYDLPPNTIQQIRAQVRNMVRSRTVASDWYLHHDWQTTTDLFIFHYSDILQRLVNFQAAEAFIEEIQSTLSSFIQDSHRGPVVNITTCASQYFPVHQHSLPVAAEAIMSVSTAICETLAHTRELGDGDLAASQGILHDLISRLDWNTWEKCDGKCARGEFCWTPVWPLGSAAERERPTCQSEVAVEFKDRYWR